MLIKNEIIIAVMIPLSVITSYYLSTFFTDKQYLTHLTNLTNLDLFLENLYNCNKHIVII